MSANSTAKTAVIIQLLQTAQREPSAATAVAVSTEPLNHAHVAASANAAAAGLATCKHPNSNLKGRSFTQQEGHTPQHYAAQKSCHCCAVYCDHTRTEQPPVPARLLQSVNRAARNASVATVPSGCRFMLHSQTTCFLSRLSEFIKMQCGCLLLPQCICQLLVEQLHVQTNAAVLPQPVASAARQQFQGKETPCLLDFSLYAISRKRGHEHCTCC